MTRKRTQRGAHGDAPGVIHQPEARRFELPDPDSGAVAFISYTRDEETVYIDSTVVPEHLRGRGLAGRLTRAALDEARNQGWTVVPRCSYVAAFITRNPEYANLVSPQSPR